MATIAPAANETPAVTSPLAHLGDERRTGRMVMRIAWPAIVENTLQTMLGIVDTILVARLGNDAVAGVGSGTQYLFLAFSIFFGVSTGSVVLIARAIGAGRPEAASHAARQSLLLTALIGAVLSLLGVVFAEPAIAILGAAPEVVRIGGSFLRIVSFGGIFLGLTLVAGGALRATGDTRSPMIVSAIANVINAVVAYGLIFGHFGLPALGADGSGWATAGARVVSAAILLWILWRGRRGLSIAGPAWWPDRSTIRRIVSFGLPTAVEQVLMTASFMAYAVITFELGTVAFATQRITFNAVTISFLPALGFMIAATTLTGQALGAQRDDLAEGTSWVAVKLAAIWMAAMGLVFFFAGDPLIRIFTDDPEVLAIGVPALRVIGIASPLWSLPLVLSGSLRGAGDTRFPMLVTLITGWAIRVPFAYLCGIVLEGGLTGIYLAVIADAIVGGGLILWRYRRGAWRRVAV